MEALLEREADVENWNDDRLDELSRRMDAGFEETKVEMREGFAKVDREMKEGFAKVEEGFAQINRKLDQLPSREEIDHRFEAVHRETNQRLDATDRRIERVNSRFEHMVWATIVVAGGFFGNLFADKF